MTDTTKTVLYWDYLADYAAYRDDYLAAMDEVCSSGRLILGSQVENFEHALAAFCGVPDAVGVNSCTDALFLALKGLGIGPGDEVITVANTAVPTVAAIRATGAIPVFVDVEEDTYVIDVYRIPDRLSERTKCIVPVHLCGLMADMGALMELARSNRLLVVEDCAQACGATYYGERAGSLGDAGAFSFYPTKVLGGFGDGGAITATRPAPADRFRSLRMYGMEETYYAEREGYNSRLDELQAAILNRKLPRLDASVNRRREIARIYDRGLEGMADLAPPITPEGRTHQYYLYTIRTERRDDLMTYLKGCGIETKINYPWPVHLMRGYDFLGYRAGDLPVTERLAATILSLPLYPEMADEAAERVVEAIHAFFGRSW